ncbi:cytochrome c biogenesis heme-transporting ATPase CcmA [Pseudothauera rhizosphaerae]|uniref:Cytochrome c biogenesis heme-transporting ATPase CcmA n=1 Tax=Pseudothauera rhizosphaerae TaxID=2565932 RepID=A0A4S4ALA8_9RHOO|nr:cytochrome c biogenesis heme-transporting ATPase CcmA [Pseudothauera rhizosphaerae]THF60306.1 cytochrome c biogenesis heme-transporting ATPase CcmA [Pseudothauera rhizosphaerae]
MLQATDLACLKGDRLLFRGLALTLGPGEMLRVAGPNGVGKTSLLRLLTGLTQPEAGEVSWHGTALRRSREDFHRALLYLGHSAALNDLLTPLENLHFACAAAGDADVDEEACMQALVRIGLARQLDLPARVLSQGQRRRVGLARLFLSFHRPLWILDEPFTALDVDAVADLAATLSDHCAAGGTVVLTTHQEAPFARAPQVLNLGAYAC